MRKIWFNFLIMATVLLAACSPAATAAPTTAANPAGSQNQGNAAAIPTRDPNATEMACKVVSAEPTPGPTEASMFPAPGKDDWIMGDNPNAAMTVIEYSDFQ